MSQQRYLIGIVVIGVLLMVGGIIYDDQPKPGPQPLSERCSDIGGEWLYKSADLICMLPDGSRLSYSPGADDFVPYSGSAGVHIAQASTGKVSGDTTCSADMDFNDFQVNQAFAGTPTIDFSTNQAARHHRTAIGKDLPAGVNFAGKYVLSIWGCGQGCKGSAVINAETGKILSYGMQALKYEFNPNSRLLIVDGVDYYAIEGDELAEICK